MAAIRAAQLGLSVTVVEKDAQFGGTCLHRGCIPTKALLHTAGLLDEARDAERFGVRIAQAELDLERAQVYKQGVVDKNAKGIDYLFKKNKIESVRGHGRIASANTVTVSSDDGVHTLEGRHILIATGSTPREIPPVPTDGALIVNSDHILELDRVPKSLIVLGSGAVGCEFASIFSSFGSEVTLVEMLPRILPLEDEEVSKELQRAFRKRRIRVLTDTTVIGAERSAKSVRVQLQRGDRQQHTEAEMLLIAVGRAPVTDDIGLEAVGIETRRRVHPSQRRHADRGTEHLCDRRRGQDPVAGARRFGGGDPRRRADRRARPAQPLNYDQVPAVTYCEPEVGSVGLTEERARAAGYRVAVGKFPFAASGKAAIEGKPGGFVKVVRETRYDQLLGVHIIGPRATDLIAEACVALRLESTTEELFRAFHAHPTLSEAVAEAAHAASGHAIHA